jgi:hypothetical protein
MTKQRKNKHSQRRSHIPRPISGSAIMIPKISRPPRQTYTIRYNLSLGGAALYTGQITSDVLASILSMSTVNGTGAPTVQLPYMDAVKIHKISLYAQDATTSSGNAVTITGTFPIVAVSNLSYGSKLIQDSATILGSAGSAQIHMRPDPKSVQGNVIAGQSSSNVFFSYTIDTGNANSSVILLVDITVSGSLPTLLGSAGTATTFSFNSSPISTFKGQVYAIPIFASLGTLCSTTAGWPVNYSPLV